MRLKLLSLLPLAIGGAAISAANVNPWSIAAIVGPLMSGVAGNILHDIFGVGDDKLANIVFGRLSPIDKNHHILLALRRCHFVALNEISVLFENANRDSKNSEFQRFSREFKLYISQHLSPKLSDIQEDGQHDKDLFGKLPHLFEVSLAARSELSPLLSTSELGAIRRDIEHSILEIIARNTGSLKNEIPAPFEQIFVSDAGGWFDLFIRTSAIELKTNQTFQAIWSAEQIARIGYMVSTLSRDLNVVNGKIDEVLDLARKLGTEKSIAEGFIASTAMRITEDDTLSLRSKMDAIRSAIDIYVRELQPRNQPSNHGEGFDDAINTARKMVDEGKSSLAQKKLRSYAKILMREEAERRDNFNNTVTAIYLKEAEIALASYDGEGAAKAIISLYQDCFADQSPDQRSFLIGHAERLHLQGLTGSNVHLSAEIELLRYVLALSEDGKSFRDRIALADALAALGEREVTDTNLNEAISMYRYSLASKPAGTDNAELAEVNRRIGETLRLIGERSFDEKLLDAALSNFNLALDLAGVENRILIANIKKGIGNVLLTYGERIKENTEKLVEAADVFRESLRFADVDVAPKVWANAQVGLGITLTEIAERNKDVNAFLAAARAFRSALTIHARSTDSALWALSIHNLGNVYSALGWQIQSRRILQRAINCYNESLTHFSQEREPIDWAMAKGNVGVTRGFLAIVTRNHQYASDAVEEIKSSLYQLQTTTHVPFTQYFLSELTKLEARFNSVSWFPDNSNIVLH